MILSSDFSIEKYGLTARLVVEEDSEFIVKLRTDKVLSRYLHPTDSSIEKQKEWIRSYKQRERNGEDYYFIFFKGDRPVGLNRMYSIHDTTFTTGSWLFDPDAPFECSIAASIIVRELAFEVLDLKFEDAYDGCHVDNKKVMKFNHMIGLRDVGTYESESGTFIKQSLSKDDFETNKVKILKLIGIE